MSSLVRPEAALAWELRGAWALGKRVVLSLDERCVVQRVEGWVSAVSATDAFAVVNGWHTPLENVLAIHNPSRLGDSTVKKHERWHGPPRRVVPQEEELPGIAA